MADIITIGEILVEILTEEVDQVFYKPGKLLGPYPSGAPAICIDQAARMGASAAIIGKVGKDDFARINLERLKGSGVDVSHVIETAENTTGVAFVTYFQDGGRQFIFHFSKAACGELAPEDVDEEAIRSARYLHIMGCSITGSPTMGEAILQAVRLAKKHGVHVSFDPNIRPELLHGKVMDYYNEIIEASDVLLSGKSELRLLFGDENAAIVKLLQEKDRIVVMKDGSRGTTVYTRADALRMAVFPAKEVDPTGAGDCFDATFLAMLCEGADLATACRYASAAGAKAVEKRGPMEGNSYRKDLEAFLAQYPDIKAETISNPYQ